MTTPSPTFDQVRALPCAHQVVPAHFADASTDTEHRALHGAAQRGGLEAHETSSGW